jgi:hypothetical protein
MPGPKSVFDPPDAPVSRPSAPPVSRKKPAKPNAMSRRGKYRLSAALSERMDDDELAVWLRTIMAGEDPDAPLDDEGNLKPSPGGFVRAPEWKDRLAAAKLYLLYRNGAPPQSVHIEGAINAGPAPRPAISPTAIRAMPPEKKAALRALLRAAVDGALAGEGASRVLPVEVAEARDANPDSSD